MVGSGPVGAVVTRRLLEAGQRILVVERGHAATDPPGSHLRNEPERRADPDGHFAAIDEHFDYLDPTAPDSGLPGAFTTRVVGGQGIVWTNNCPRTVSGLDRPAVLTDSEWDHYYSIAEKYLSVRTDEFSDSERGRLVADRLRSALHAQGRRVEPLPLAGRRLDAEHIHFVGPADVLPTSANVEMRRGQVERVEMEGGRAGPLRVDGRHYDAATMVLAAGAVDTPRILWRSGLRPRALGRYLSYHPVLIAQIVLDRDGSGAGVGPDPLPRLGIPPTADQPWFTMLLRDTNPLPVASDDRAVEPHRLIEVQAFAPVDPRFDNRMEFHDDTGVSFHVPLSSDDEDRRRAIESDVEQLCELLGRYRRGCHPQWAPLGSPHLVGSCRMGLDPDTSVADALGRVHGTENLYLATNGLIPTRLAVNPTLTTAALGIRSADQIAG